MSAPGDLSQTRVVSAGDEGAPLAPLAELGSETRRAGRPVGRTVRRYVLRQLAATTGFVLGTFVLATVAADLVTYSDLVVNRGFGTGEVGVIAFYRLLPIVGQTLPFGLLVAILVTLGRLGATREVLALETSGVQPLRLTGAALIFGLAATAVSLAISYEAAPRFHRALNAQILEAALRNPGAALRAGSVATFGDTRLESRGVAANGDGLTGMSMWVPPMGETVFAQRGNFHGDGESRVRVVLEDGVFLLPVQGEISQIRFERLEQELELDPKSVEVIEPLGFATSQELWEKSRSAGSESARRSALAEVHRRIALPFAAAIFAVIAVPLGLVRGTASRSAGAGLGLVCTLGYYGLVQLGNGLVRGDEVPVALAVWIPNAVFLALALLLLLTARDRRERVPLRARLFPKRSRSTTAVAPRSGRGILDRYVLVRFAELAALCFGVLLFAYLLIDVMDNLKWFTKYSSTPLEVLRYYAARLPLLISRTLPLALVAASALTTSLLAANGELVGMRACGISIGRTVTPIVIACAFLGLFYHVLANEWVPHANILASRIKNTEIKNRSLERHRVWYRSRASLYEIDRLDPLGGVAQGITFYNLGEDGLPVSRNDATRARHIGDGVWRLSEPARLAITPTSIRTVKSGSYAELGDDVPAGVNMSDLSLGQLREQIAEATRDGHDVTPLRVDAHLRLAAPLACIVLPALALAYAAIGPPFPSLAQMLVVSFAIALAHGLLTAVGAALGYGRVLPPMLAGWGPIALVALGGAWIARSARRLRRRGG